MSGKRILITGGAGFIGSSIVRYLLEHYPQHHITNLDALTYAGNLENLASVENNPSYRFVHGDIRDRQQVDALMKDADICINTAAQTHVDRSIDGPEVFITTNIQGTHTLLESGRQHGLKKFIQISTDEVYGSLGPTGYFSETSPLDPSSPYSASKTSADLLALSYFKTYDFPVCVTRCSNNYGPYQYPEKLIPLFVLNALAGKSVPLYGDGLNVRDWIHVEDHTRAVLAVMEKGQPGQVYNIGANQEQSNLEITRKILSYLSRPESDIEYVADRLGHDRRYAIDANKITTELGWKPLRNFDEALKDTIEWYRAHEEWVHNIARREQGIAALADS